MSDSQALIRKKKKQNVQWGIEESIQEKGGSEKSVGLAKCVLSTDWDASRLIALGPT